MKDALKNGKSGNEYQKALDTFHDILLSQMGDFMLKDEVIEFVYKGKDQLGISVRMQQMQYMNSADLRRRLVAVYVGDKTVTPELRSILKRALLDPK
jgi:hypothetical protein